MHHSLQFLYWLYSIEWKKFSSHTYFSQILFHKIERFNQIQYYSQEVEPIVWNGSHRKIYRFTKPFRKSFVCLNGKFWTYQEKFHIFSKCFQKVLKEGVLLYINGFCCEKKQWCQFIMVKLVIQKISKEIIDFHKKF